MDKSTKTSEKFSTALYIEEDILDVIDRWIAKKNKEETVGRFSRNCFIRNAVMEKIEDLGLIDGEAK